jgi:hypothetical protein
VQGWGGIRPARPADTRGLPARSSQNPGLRETTEPAASTRASREPESPAPRKREPGRPSKFTPDLGWKLVALLVAGVPLVRACDEIGISPRTAQRWRARAWSRAPGDAPYVAIERALWRGRGAAAELGQSSQAKDVAQLQPLDDVVADFARELGLDSERAQFAPHRPSQEREID